jgi:hypothetical protein
VILEHHAELAAKLRNAARLDAGGVLLLTMNTWPRVGRSMSAISFRMLLLPAPEWPVRKVISPSSMWKDTPASASRPFA